LEDTKGGGKKRTKKSDFHQGGNWRALKTPHKRTPGEKKNL